MTCDSTPIVAVLNLPAGSILCLDGEQVALKRDDFVGFSSVPRTPAACHLLTTRGAHQGSKNGNSIGVTVGFLVVFKESDDIFVRCYDLSTEEVSPVPVDPLTYLNLLGQVERSEIDPHRLVRYDQFISQPRQEGWKELTRFISESFLRQHHDLQSGDKIVPSTLDDNDDDTLNLSSAPRPTSDGVAVTYPFIPVINAIQTARHSQHKGTRQFLARLPGPKRSELFLHPHSSDLVLDLVINMHYESDWRLLLADLQLSYLLFVHLHCFASLQCWRDLIALLSLPYNINERAEMYTCLVETLLRQLISVDREFFDDVDMSGGDSLSSSIRRLASRLMDGGDPQLSALALKLSSAMPMLQPAMDIKQANDPDPQIASDDEDADDEDADDDDEPVVVASEEFESSLLHIASSAPARSVGLPAEEIRKEYPLLVAAMTPSEDIVMTCARALDVAGDVSLVREAARYLELVEAKRF